MENNRICDLLGIEYPIIQAPMNWVSGARLAAAVSNAGGLGCVRVNAGSKTMTTDVEVTAERLRRQIREVKSLTDRPFAVNIAVGFTESQRGFSKRCLDVVLEEKVKIAIVTVGSPDVYTKVLKDGAVKVLHAVSTSGHAVHAEKAGVDAVICEGFEGGGHKGFTELTSFVLIPMVADAVKIPVVAGGGIGDARGIVAAIVLGADGVYIGTRFMMTQESESNPQVKEAVIRGEDVCTISVPKEKMLARDLKNHFTRTYLEMKEEGASSSDLANYFADHSEYHAQVLGNADQAEICCGQVAALIKRIESVSDVMKNLVEGTRTRREELMHKLAPFIERSMK